MVKLELSYPESKLKESKRLWRYIDVYKFYDMIARKHIPFPRMSSFEDRLEGMPLGLILDLNQDRDTLGSPVSFQDFLSRKDSFPTETQKRIESYDEIRNTTYVSCWFHANHESMAMWNLYAGKDGVAISVDAASLIGEVCKHLDNAHDASMDAAYAGFVEYKDMLPLEPEAYMEQLKVGRIALRKHKSYEHEKEFRIVFRRKKPLEDDSRYMNIPIADFKSIDARFYTHPEMSDWKRFTITQMAAKYGLDVTTRASMIPLGRRDG